MPPYTTFMPYASYIQKNLVTPIESNEGKTKAYEKINYFFFKYSCTFSARTTSSLNI